MRLIAAFVAMAAYAQAAALQGIVLDFESGHALARTVVTLTPLQNQGGVPATTRTESNGTFFLNAAPGVYLLTLAREGFATYRHGAVCGACPGAPLYLETDLKVPLDIRMRRLGAITGSILDENQVGIPHIPMLVYAFTRPLGLVEKAETDDRGSFRFGLLTPGQYMVRTAATKTTDGMSYLATFYQDTTEVRLGQSVRVELDRTWGNVDFHVVPGKLYKVQGILLMPVPGITDSIELISETGRQKTHVAAGGEYTFDNVEPGNYEMYAEGRTPTARYAAWTPFLVEKDTDLNVPMAQCPFLAITMFDEQHKHFQSKQVKILMRRKDLDKEGPIVQVSEGKSDIAPGDWQIKIDGGVEFYAKDVRVASKKAEMRARESAEDWVVGRVPYYSVPPVSGVPTTVILSSRVGSITGRVTNHPNEVVPYAPVWLERIGLEPPDPMIVRDTRTTNDGSFEFHGLPPGKYRLLSSFELDISDRMEVEKARPAELTINEGGSVLQDISLYHKP